jgi:hypothetical protein
MEIKVVQSQEDNTAESTGRLPPTPKLHNAAKQPMAAKLGDPAAIIPKTAVIPRVALNASLRPKISQPKPQNIAPARRPMFCARERRGGRDGENSLATAVTWSVSICRFQRY